MKLDVGQELVVLEAEVVKRHLDKLEAFIVCPQFLQLTTPDQVLLRQQFTHMSGYLFCLEQRIERFQAQADAPAASPGATL